VITIQDQVAKVHFDVSKQGREQVLNWVCSHDYSGQLKVNTELHQAGTGQWLLDDPTFMEWEKSSSSSTIFCHGGPGTGKTIMSAQVVRYLQEKLSDFGQPILYIFCDYKMRAEPNKMRAEQNEMRAEQNITHLLSSLLRQLGFFSSNVFKILNQLHARGTRGSSQLGKPDLEQALEKSLKIVGDTYIVVDALDECEKGACSQLIEMLREKSSRHTIHLFATARREPDIEALFEGCPAIFVEASEGDVKLYAKERTKYFEQSLMNNQDLCSEVVEAVVKASEGM
jgi:hypothetical protein